MIKRLYLIILVSLITVSVTFAQQQKTTITDTTHLISGPGKTNTTNTIDIHFNGFAFLDDHEYDALIPLRKTISGTRTEIDLGYNVDSLNHFVVGVNPLHEFGGVPYFVMVNPVAYYTYTGKHWLFNAGEFPRNELLNYPRALINDSVQYFRPNVEGLLLRNTNRFGHETGWIDWVSRQTPTQRNEFMAGELGTFIPNPGHAFYVSHYLLFMHNAGTKSDTAAPIRDQGGFQLRFGLDYSHKTVFDSLKFEAGYMFTEHRIRSMYSWETSQGFVASVYISRKRFSIFDEFYKGQANYLTFGDPFYSKTIYNRLDFMYTAFIGKHLKGQFFLGLHQSPSHLDDTEPGFRMVYDIGRKVIARFKDDQ
ncbi:MAG TPA: hypothetical protein DCO83_17530 [Mucilaginibacter sp.]|jgi:hypothetical protein|nr:hypothetical protein [Mucilaginibacter sp.]